LLGVLQRISCAGIIKLAIIITIMSESDQPIRNS
jgi:hypothetical protein